MEHQPIYMGNQEYKHEYENIGWEMEKCDRNITADEHENDRFEMVLHLHRRATFYAIVLIFPCVLLNALSLTIFTLSLKDTERETFAITLILTYFVLFDIIVNSSPPSGTQTPVLGLYVILSTVVVVITFVMSLILIEMHEHFRVKNAQMPKWILHILENPCIILLFTSNRHFGRSKNQENRIFDDNTENGEKVRLSLKGKSSKSIKRQNSQYQWKVFLKLLNFLFFLISLVSHIVVAYSLFIRIP